MTEERGLRRVFTLDSDFQVYRLHSRQEGVVSCDGVVTVPAAAFGDQEDALTAAIRAAFDLE